jgi:hypothetical protein
VYEIHLVEPGTDGWAGIGHQSSEEHCRRVAAYLTELVPGITACCGRLDQNGYSWIIFAEYKNGQELFREKSSDYVSDLTGE